MLLAPTLAAMAAAARLAPLPRPFFEARGEPSDDQDEGGGGGGGSGGGGGGGCGGGGGGSGGGGGGGGCGGGGDALPLVRIVHASDDGFCPASQRRELDVTGAATQLCEGGHDLGGARAEHAVLQHFAACVADARECRKHEAALPPG